MCFSGLTGTKLSGAHLPASSMFCRCQPVDRSLHTATPSLNRMKQGLFLSQNLAGCDQVFPNIERVSTYTDPRKPSNGAKSRVRTISSTLEKSLSESVRRISQTAFQPKSGCSLGVVSMIRELMLTVPLFKAEVTVGHIPISPMSSYPRLSRIAIHSLALVRLQILRVLAFFHMPQRCPAARRYIYRISQYGNSRILTYALRNAYLLSNKTASFLTANALTLVSANH